MKGWLKRTYLDGFTLIELMVTVAIIFITSVVIGININSRMNIANLESAAQQIASDLTEARSSALLKGCPVRLVFCQDPQCSTFTSTSASNGTTSFIGTTSQPAVNYALLRMAQNSYPTKPCYNSSAVPIPGWTYWTFDRRPQQISKGLIFTPIYTGTNNVPNTQDWWDKTVTTNALVSIWFDSNYGLLTPNPTTNVPQPPVSNYNVLLSNGQTAAVVMQVALGSCNANSATGDCVGYLLTATPGGEIDYLKCAPGSRADNSLTCF